MPNNKENIETIRHSLSHILAAAVLDMFPEAKLGMGPAIENGFYYDFDLPQTLIPEDLKLIEDKMRKLIDSDLEFEHSEDTIEDALKKLKNSKQNYKCELVEDLKEKGEKNISLYKTGTFIDLCKGPHIKSTADLKNAGWKLDKIAGAYWKGTEKNKMLQRIYGIAFESKEELDDYLKIRVEAEKRDHKKLGRELELFIFDESAPGMPYWLPKGVKLYNALVEFWRKEHEKHGYQEFKSPIMNKKELYEKSGHWEHYRENMFIIKTEEKETYAVKAMSCPNAIIVYGQRPRSYRELPLRLSDVDLIHRNELSGTLNGLFRVRMFSQDDSHNFIAEDKIEEEYADIFEIVEKFYSVFDLEYSYRLGTRPDDFMGEAKIWDKADSILKNLLEKSGKKYSIEEGDGAFYGPKVDILMKDSLGREWQMGTIQLDFQLPLKFDLKYTNEQGEEKMPVIVHRVIYGSLERFIGILTEHFSGAFPVWIAPVQAIVLPISDKVREYAGSVTNELKEAGVRVEIDDRNESIGKKIRDAEMQKIPFMIILGEKEMSAKKITIRKYSEGDQGQKSIEELISQICPKKS
ncbi:MAG: threonine--tRNA ligase [Candidatus Berkelbacteria bacterium]|nr:threonine--tRNA ligase [Candidatus Berkelbacteria bacterium]